MVPSDGCDGFIGYCPTRVWGKAVNPSHPSLTRHHLQRMTINNHAHRRRHTEPTTTPYRQGRLSSLRKGKVKAP